jgi:hypothetical protein
MRTMIIAAGLAFAFFLAAAPAQDAAAPAQDLVAPATDARRSEPPEAAPRPQPALPQTFRSPESGFAAMAAAARAHDERRLLRVLGSEARRLIRSGDPAADRAARERFAAAYAVKAEILQPTADTAILQVGDDGWPLPIPMVRRGGVWRFDARQGVQEMVNRHIGRNELDTIEVLHAIIAAQDEYARTVGRQGAFSSYARRFFSTPGTHDGLYWPAAAGEPESPLGPLAAAASSGGYGTGRVPDDKPKPFHGYLFRILEAQGPATSGGAMDYVVGERMIGGFGVIAVPAEYGVSGIQTFLVSHAGTVYQRNLGPDTARIARGITAFDPGPGWEKVPE